MEKISVIVPVYNAEAYLKQCLDSIVQQTYDNLEIILINDGATDASAAICQDYKKQDERIKVYHKQNGGVASSRNRALEAVTGDYILFVDCDDWLELDHIQSLYDLLKKHQADVAIGNFTQFMEDEGNFLIHVDSDHYFEQVYTPFEWFKHQYDPHLNLSQCFTVPWAKLYKADLFKDIVYPTDKKVEDDYTTYKVYLEADKIVYMNRAIYLHRKRDTSVTRQVSLADVFPLTSIAERLMVLHLVGAPQELLDNEVAAYKWRLGLHEQETLKFGQMEAYQQVVVKKAMMGKQEGFKEKSVYRAFTMTQTQDLEQVTDLIQSLPEVAFHIGAWTALGPELTKLASYSNVHLHPAMTQDQLFEQVKQMDLYLDINLGAEAGGVMDLVEDSEKPLFAFYKTQHGNRGQYLFSSERPKEMTEAIRNFLEERELPEAPHLPEVLSIDKSLDYISTHGASVIRFGDGEINLMAGHSIAYQNYDPQLAQELRDLVARSSTEKLLVCLPDAFGDRFVFTWWAEDFWKKHLDHYDAFYRELAPAPWYGSTFISRPYIDFADKSKAKDQFDKLKSLWKDRDILIVEGATSRSGVGNDLFEQARSIKRIVCSSHNAYFGVEEIEAEICQQADDRLILIMLGPTAKVLAASLSDKGYQALDIGHIDSEYEWLQMGAETKVKLAHKHTAEYNFDQDIEYLEDGAYSRQIVADLSGLPQDHQINESKT